MSKIPGKKYLGRDVLQRYWSLLCDCAGSPSHQPGQDPYLSEILGAMSLCMGALPRLKCFAINFHNKPKPQELLISK